MKREFTLGTYALNDHMDRLYDLHSPTAEDEYHHVDGESAGTIKVLNEGKKTSKVIMSDEAVKEFLSDMDYQIEICETQDDLRYKNQCKRAFVSIKKQLS